MKWIALVLLVPCLLTAGCRGSSHEEEAAGAPSAPTGDLTQRSNERTASIYAAVVRKLLAENRTFGGAQGPKVVYVLDGPVVGAADAGKRLDQLRPDNRFPAPVKQGLKERLADLKQVTFVRQRASVIEGDETGSSPGHVINHGVLLTLGPIQGNTREVKVANNLWANGLAGRWGTFVVRFQKGAWKVIGASGPLALS